MSQLRQTLDHVLTALEAEHGDSVPLTADYYWVLNARPTYGVSSDPSADQYTIGQLSDDVATLDEILEREDDFISVWHDLAHLGGILHRLATQDLPRTT
jgi:hypothetical protein